MKGYIILTKEEVCYFDLDISNERYTRWWWKIVAMANWRDGTRTISGESVFVKRGQLVTTFKNLAGLFRCSEATVSRFFKIAESQNLMTRETLHKGTLITILNYDKYQPFSGSDSNENPDDTTEEVGRKLARKMPQYEEKKKTNKSNKKRREGEALLSFEEEEKIYERLKNDDEFWTNLKDALEAPIEELKVYFEKFRKSMLVQQYFHKSETDLRGHIRDYAKKILESNATKQQTTEINGNRYDARRGSDVPNDFSQESLEHF